jgi:hypothetical protein
LNTKDWSHKDKKNISDYLKYNAFCSERYRLFYVSTPKVASTRLKWWFASLEGYSQELKKIITTGESDPDLDVHHSHQVAPLVAGLQFSEICSIIESDSYFKFAVVRNPYKRIFSAWQSKILLRDPLQIQPYISTDFYNHPIKTAADIAQAFESFLEHLAKNEAPSYWNYHWTPQAYLLRPDLISYSCLTKIEENEKLTERLREWLGTYITDPFDDNHYNESLIPYDSKFITQRSSELISSLYIRDFDLFGYDKQIPSGKEEFLKEKFDVAIKAVKTIRGRHQVLGERSELIGRLNQTLTNKDKELEQTKHALTNKDKELEQTKHALTNKDKELEQTKHELATMFLTISWKITRPLRKIKRFFSSKQ